MNPAKQANINIVTLNVRGATAANVSLLQKWSSISQTIYENRIVILTLQETHLDQNKTRQVRKCFNKNLEIITSEDPEDPTGRAGVAFIIHKTVLNPKDYTMQELYPGRALLLKIKWLESCETSLLNIYVPTTQIEQQPFWDRVDTTRREKRLAHPEIVLGDFNITEDKIDWVKSRKCTAD